MANPSDGAAFRDVALFKTFLDRIGFAPSSIALAVVMALAVALLEGISVALLLPLARGVVSLDFAFARWAPGLALLVGAFERTRPISNSEIFTVLVALVFLFSLAKNALQYASSVSLAYEVRKLADKLRRTIFERYLGFGRLFFDRSDAGHLNTVLTGLTATISARLIDLHLVFVWLFMVVAYLLVMSCISWKLTGIVLLVFPVLHFSLQWIIRRIRETSRLQTQAQAALSKKVFNTLACMPVIKAYARERGELEEFARTSDEHRRLEFSIDRKAQLVVPLQEVIVLLLVLLLICAMAALASNGESGLIPGFLVYFYCLRRATTTFGFLNGTKATFASISGPLAEVVRLLDDAEKHFVPSGSRSFVGLRRSIEFADLRFAFPGGGQVLDGVRFSLERGSMTAIVGPSGAGKSTLMNLLARAYDCPPGAISIDGSDIRDFEVSSLRLGMALVMQEALLFNDTLRANITYGLAREIDDRELRTVLEKARLTEFVGRLPAGLRTIVGDRGVQLSGGEKQRVSIARAMLKGADILILDEATSSLDGKTESLIQQAIDEMIRNKTAVVIAHRLSTIKRADKIVVLEGGKVVEQGALEDLLNRKGRFHEYWEHQKFY